MLSVPHGLGFRNSVDHTSIHRDADAQRGDGDWSVEGSRVGRVVESDVGHLGITLPVAGQMQGKSSGITHFHLQEEISHSKREEEEEVK